MYVCMYVCMDGWMGFLNVLHFGLEQQSSLSAIWMQSVIWCLNHNCCCRARSACFCCCCCCCCCCLAEAFSVLFFLSFSLGFALFCFVLFTVLSFLRVRQKRLTDLQMSTVGPTLRQSAVSGNSCGTHGW